MTPRLKPLDHPLVSVVVTAYNEANVVSQAIDTLLAQSYKNLELVLVNNGSTDDTTSVLAKYATRKNVRVIDLKKNTGPGGGRNVGAKVARGEILIIVDADMVFDKDYVRGLIAPVVKGTAIGSFHDRELVKNKEKLWARSLSINRVENPGETSGVFRAVLRKPFLAMGGFDTSKGYFDDDLHVLGASVRAHALCYHNNPETLSELFHHALWVGRSLIRHPDLRSRFLPVVVLGWLAIFSLPALALFGYGVVACWFFFAGLMALALFLLFKAIPRACKEGYPEFIITVPIVWVVRLVGFFFGATRQATRPK